MSFKDVYRKYYQKSKLFLYPILGIPQGYEFTPAETYLKWEDTFELGDCKLICVYDKIDSQEYRAFESEYLLSNTLFYDYYLLPENQAAYVFDFSTHAADFRRVSIGKYSELSTEFKHKILHFFSASPSSYAYMDTYMYPNKHYDMYSELLNCDVTLLEEVGELCSSPDIDKETLLTKAISFAELNKFLNLSK